MSSGSALALRHPNSRLSSTGSNSPQKAVQGIAGSVLQLTLLALVQVLDLRAGPQQGVTRLGLPGPQQFEFLLHRVCRCIRCRLGGRYFYCVIRCAAVSGWRRGFCARRRLLCFLDIVFEAHYLTPVRSRGRHDYT